MTVTPMNWVEAATLAPSVHNTQPWRFQIARDHIDVSFDADRRLAYLDPSGREAIISVGAAVLNLRVAILGSGRTPVTTLLPDPTAPGLAARVAIGAARRPDESIRALASAIAKRHTNRRPFRDIPVRDEVLAQLTAAARVEGAHLAIADDAGARAILSLTRTANARQSADPAYVEELRLWTTRPEEARDGVPAHAFGPRDRLDPLPLRDFGQARPATPRRSGRFEAEPTIAVLYTAADQPIDWLRAGQALERVLLTATVRGVVSTPITAPVELPELRGLLDVDDHLRSAQMILRLGYGDPCAATPRRPVAEVVTALADMAGGRVA